MRSFTDTFIKHPVLAIVVNLVILLVGYRAVSTLPVQQYPKIESSQVLITTVYFGASAETVRGFLTTPIERAVSAISGVDYVESTSRAGVSTITVHLKLNHSSTAALAEVTARLQQVRSELPSEAEPPVVEVQRADRPYASFYLSFTSNQRDIPALTDWLTRYFNTLAGMDPNGRPLTFGDLWGAPMETIEADAANTPARDRRLDLQVMTTAVSQKMCYAIPFREGAGQFYYDRAEWAALFPPSVMAWLDQVSAVADAGQDAVTRAGGVSLRRLPSGRYLPVVVAVRLSLSFPVLLSALPLYQIDYSMPDDVKNKRATRVWFSDGGLSSNMPLHFFDAALPGRPTFAINLKDEHPAHRIDPDKKACDQEGRVFLAGNKGGRIQHWPPPNDGTPMGLFDFLFGIVDTMQNWRDEIQFPYPGYRDRIVQISQLPDEGGLNLNMPKPQIDALSDAGDCAAVTLIHRFLSNPTSTADGWENHRDIRMRTFLALMEDLVTGASLHDPAWNAVIQDAVVRKHYSNDQALVAQTLLNGLRGMGTAVTNGGTSLVPPPAAPRPRPQMIIAPYI